MRRLDVAYALRAAIASAGLLHTGLNLWTDRSVPGFCPDERRPPGDTPL
ncbi:hypothetical protein [Nonomuraea rhodomycinica]|uniref:Uncharacterized protein n=1 Tax=Nonomuraea rhodomycinica TaxID=1712872 RepID=A0A7Y6MEV9_9ACTN|nr:hypothetical protein [Nonomuraea rhodomycinica]NUW44360.1 hypothetical protein [Nonomuraea rhodomycinica]